MRTALFKPTPPHPVTAIARAMGEEGGTRWEDVSPAQWDADIAQAQWIIGILAAAGYTIAPASAPQALAS